MRHGTSEATMRYGVPAWWAMIAALLVGCGSDQMSSAAAEFIAPAEVIPGLAAEDELVIVPMPPQRSDASFRWTRAYKAADLPVVSIGRPTQTLMAGEAGDMQPGMTCTGSEGNARCRPVHDSRPLLAGEWFTSRDLMAWVWIGVPNETVAVQFTGESGHTLWQRPIDGVVIFPDQVHADGNCRCRLDAFDTTGDVTASVDVATARFIDF